MLSAWHAFAVFGFGLWNKGIFQRFQLIGNAKMTLVNSSRTNKTLRLNENIFADKGGLNYSYKFFAINRAHIRSYLKSGL